MTGYASDGVMQALTDSAGAGATSRPALRIVQMIVLLSMGIISLTVKRLSAPCGQSRRNPGWKPEVRRRAHPGDGIRR